MRPVAIFLAAIIFLGHASTSMAQSDSEPRQELEPRIISDFDSDGWTDSDDNCPAHVNPLQVDSDGDAKGDACDECDKNRAIGCDDLPPDVLRELSYSDYARSASVSDSDRDGYSNLADNCPTIANHDQADQDDDGVGDSCDNCPDVPAPGFIDGCRADQTD